MLVYIDSRVATDEIVTIDPANIDAVSTATDGVASVRTSALRKLTAGFKRLSLSKRTDLVLATDGSTDSSPVSATAAGILPSARVTKIFMFFSVKTR